MRVTTHLLAAGMVVLVTLGCSDAEKAARRLDEVACSIDRYGFASISTPFLVGPHDGFSFELNKEASEYFDLAMKPQGSVRHYAAEALDVQVAVRFNAEQAILAWNQLQRARDINEIREAKRRAALQLAQLNAVAPVVVNDGDKKLFEATQGLLSAVAEQPEPSAEALPGFTATQPAKPLLPLPVGDRLGLAAVKSTFTDALPMPGDSLQLSAREAILTAGGDIMTQSLLRWFINPEKNKQGDYELFFCPIIVSVQPGTETRRGYLADLTVGVDLARGESDGSLRYLSEYFPHSSPPIQVAGVFPVVDSQILDLANSRRQLFSMAIQMAAMGFGTQAEAFIDYARKLEQDAKTSTSLTVASAYTVSSNCFGFRVEPKFVASVDPGRLRTEPGEILESKTFPAMAIVLIHRSYLHHKDDEPGGTDKLRHQSVEGDSPARSAMKACRSNEEAGVFDYLVFRTSVRWAPAQSGWFAARCSEMEALRRAESLEEAEKLIACESRTGIPWDVLGSRAMSLRKLALDSQALVRVWHARESAKEVQPAKLVVVRDVAPEQGWWNQWTVLTLSGRGFADNVKAVVVGGVQCQFAVVGDSRVLVLVPPWGERQKGLQPLPGAILSAAAGAATADIADCPSDPKHSVFRAQIRLISSKPVCWGEPREAEQSTASDAGSQDQGDHERQWVSFDRQLPPSGPASPTAGSISFLRDANGRITGVQTGEGGFDHGHELLKALGTVLKNDPRFSVDLVGSGTVQVKPKPVSPNPNDSPTPVEKPEP